MNTTQTLSRPTTLTPWKHPEFYMGENWNGWFCSPVGVHRDSGPLDRSNWNVQRTALLALAQWHPAHEDEHEDEWQDVIEVTESHWAVGWVSWIAIHPTNLVAIELAEDIQERLKDYPVLDEDAYSELRWDEANEYAETEWQYMTALKRLETLRRLGEDIPSLLQCIGPESSPPSSFVVECEEHSDI